MKGVLIDYMSLVNVIVMFLIISRMIFVRVKNQKSDHKLLIFSILWVVLSSAGVVLGINDNHYMLLGIVWGAILALQVDGLLFKNLVK